jgi:hypothetical protein
MREMMLVGSTIMVSSYARHFALQTLPQPGGSHYQVNPSI